MKLRLKRNGEKERTKEEKKKVNGENISLKFVNKNSRDSHVRNSIKIAEN